MAESSENNKSSRGNFLKKGVFGIVAGAGFLGLGYEAIRQSSKHETIIDFSTGNVDYRFLGGTHGNSKLDERINIQTTLTREMIPESTTFFELETGDFDYLSPDVYAEIEVLYTRGKDAKSLAFAKEVLYELAHRELPLVLTDVPTSGLDPAHLEGAIGTGLFTTLGLASLRERKATRRNFLRAGTLASGLTAIRPFSLQVMSFLQAVIEEPWAQKLAKINHAVELSQPESLLVTFRNSVIAAKTLGLEDEFPKDPNTSKPYGLLICGSGHWGIPEYLKSGKQSIMNYLSLYPRPFIESVFGGDNPHLYTSVIMTPKPEGMLTEKKEDPDLQRVFSK